MTRPWLEKLRVRVVRVERPEMAAAIFATLRGTVPPCDDGRSGVRILSRSGGDGVDGRRGMAGGGGHAGATGWPQPAAWNCLAALRNGWQTADGAAPAAPRVSRNWATRPPSGWTA